MRSNYHYTPRACVFKKSYGDIFLTVVLELPKGDMKKDPRRDAIRMFKDELINLINDTEMENLLKPKKQ